MRTQQADHIAASQPPPLGYAYTVTFAEIWLSRSPTHIAIYNRKGLVIMAPCGGAVGQDWALNRTGWPTMPNASLSILLPAYPDDGNTDYGCVRLILILPSFFGFGQALI